MFSLLKPATSGGCPAHGPVPERPADRTARKTAAVPAAAPGAPVEERPGRVPPGRDAGPELLGLGPEGAAAAGAGLFRTKFPMAGNFCQNRDSRHSIRIRKGCLLILHFIVSIILGVIASGRSSVVWWPPIASRASNGSGGARASRGEREYRERGNAGARATLEGNGTDKSGRALG